jgi:phosphoserine phosphatase
MTLSAARRPELVPAFIRELPLPDGPRLAVFDADGVLWQGDIADEFTLAMIESGHVNTGALWPEYQRIFAVDAAAGCRFLLSFYQGWTLADLQPHLDRFWQRERRWNLPVIETIHWLVEREFAVWVCSCSPTAFLAPALHQLPIERVLGLEFELDRDGTITGWPAGITTAGPGKADCIRKAAGDRRVLLAAGNSRLDVAMLELASGLAWAIEPDPTLLEAAQRHGWQVTRDLQAV